ncbi:hypothetical protein RchiOBHm_Chr7g0202551 [Rosa chinensis]|uniref:Uncharacterized protein n=1 Tax=Rosa chinensis TaxID=74649 RepID=A0A2P6P8A2_ROSCH|nr:hypothetical protein RchiOBHm_Chr7g0202551 [Rosa chinensis]
MKYTRLASLPEAWLDWEEGVTVVGKRLDRHALDGVKLLTKRHFFEEVVIMPPTRYYKLSQSIVP